MKSFNKVSSLLDNLYYTSKNFNPNDYELFSSKLSVAASKQNYRISNLGDIDHFPLILLTPRKLIKAPNVLICSGFHGNEPSPCWAVLRVLETTKNLLKGCNVSFMPCVNPTGFINDKRNNIMDENPNRGFAYSFDKSLPKKETIISAEGKLILAHINLIKFLSRSAFITLHEDETENEFYLYSDRVKGTTSKLENSLIKTGSKYFGIVKKSVIDKGNKDAVIINGLARNISDGSLEDYLFRHKTPHCICTETPAKKDFVKRVVTNMNLIHAFVNYFSKMEI